MNAVRGAIYRKSIRRNHNIAGATRLQPVSYRDINAYGNRGWSNHIDIAGPAGSYGAYQYIHPEAAAGASTASTRQRNIAIGAGNITACT